MIMKRLVVLLLPVFLGCADKEILSPPMVPPPSPPAAPLSLSLVMWSGNGQRGEPGRVLDLPLVVQVRDGAKQGVAGQLITWTVASGTGELWDGGTGTYVPGPVTAITGEGGLASARFRGVSDGTVTVSAAAEEFSSQVAMFTVQVGMLAMTIRFGPFDWCESPFLFDIPADSVSVGAVVEFEYGTWAWGGCQAQLISLSAPSGGTPFSSGYLQPGDRFRFVADAPGLWTFGEVLHGGFGVLKVK
jgi:hypothetical protein